MFQNISGNTGMYEDTEYIENGKINTILKQIFTKQKIIIYIATFMLSTIECTTGVAPFAIAIFAACCSNKIPTLIVYILSLLGTFIGLGSGQALTYLLTSIVFIVMTLILKPKEQDEYENEKLKLGKYVFLSSFLVQASSIFFEGFLIYDLLASIMVGIASYIFYKIFSNALILISEFGIKKAFSIEEVLAASILLSICAAAFRDFSIFGFELRTILTILIVLVLGWKNGVLVGASSGITIGTILGIIVKGDPTMIATYALSGMIAGIFSKFGRAGVIIGFILGNSVLLYVTNGSAEPVIYFKEVLIASLGLLLVPKNIKIDIEELFDKTQCLPVVPLNRIGEDKETIYKLNNVSEAISEIAETYKEVAATVVDEEQEETQKNEKIFIEELGYNIGKLNPQNILYEDFIDIENLDILSDIFKILINNQVLKREDLLDIFAKYNNYIVGFDDENVSQVIEKDIKEVLDIINDSYKISKVKFMWEQKIDENKRTISNQLEGVSKVISSLADDMEEQTIKDEHEFIIEKEEIMTLCREKNIPLEDIKIKREETGRYVITVYKDTCSVDKKEECYIDRLQIILSKVFNEKIVAQNIKCGVKLNNSLCVNTFVSEDKYLLQVGISKTTKHESPISGDNSLSTKLNDGKYLLAISDGMGSGIKASQSSKIAIKMLERLLTTGFNKDTSIELINSTLSLNTEEDSYATLDIAILDLYSGNIEFIKNGACPTYIKHNKNVQIIKSLSLPAGILENINLVVYDRDIDNNDIMVMCSDGIMESNTEYQNKELWLKNILEQIETDNVQKIADIITKEAIDNGFGIAKDDMTIIVAKFIKK